MSKIEGRKSNDETMQNPQDGLKSPFPAGFLVVALSDIDKNKYQRIVQYKNSTECKSVQGGGCDKRVYPQYGNQSNIVDRCKKSQKWLTEEEIEQAIVAYKGGATVYKLADQFGCHRNTISNHLKRHSVDVTIKKIATEADVQNLIALYEGELTTGQVAKKLGVSTTTVKKHLQQNGVKMRTRWDYRNKK
jgi:DNA-binding CsgD family transcriptional regulator